MLESDITYWIKTTDISFTAKLNKPWVKLLVL